MWHNKEGRGKRGGKIKIKVVISSRSVDKSSRGVCLQNISRIKPAPTSFQFLTLNCQSVGNKELLLNDLVFDYKPDIVFCTETWLLEKGDEVRIKSLTPPLYVSDNFPRLTGPGGGILIINKNGTTVKTIRITGQSTFECTKSKININSSSITVFCVYRPPPSNKNNYKVTTFISEFNDFLENHLTSNEKCIILGDFNLHFDCPDNTYVKQMIDLLNMRNLSKIVDKPTQRAGHTLDWIISEDTKFISNVNICDKAISDHSVITFNIDMDSVLPSKRDVISRNIKLTNTNSFKSKLRECGSFINSQVDKVDHYNKSLQCLIDKHAPLRTRAVTDRASAPWMNSYIKCVKSDRRSAERKWRKSGSTVDRIAFKALNITVKDSIKYFKRLFF